MVDLNKEFKYFLANRIGLFKQYPDKFLLIQGESVKGSFDTFDKAIDWATSNNFVLGEFLIQQCTESEDGFTQKFNSRVAFN